jgi:hypothetical protein
MNPDVIGIDLGISMLMAENARTGFVWKTFMKNPEASEAMNLVFGSSRKHESTSIRQM